MQNQKRLFELFSAYFRGTASEAEAKELALLVAGESDKELSAVMQQTWEEVRADAFAFPDGVRRGMLEKLAAAPDESKPVFPVQPVRKLTVFRMLAAAVVVGLLSMTAFVWLKGRRDKLVAEHATTISPATDAEPGDNKAILTLSDGTVITLDGKANGVVSVQGKTKVLNNNGQLAYNAQTPEAELLYNTVSTPRGGQYRLVLSDGTRVWLNAASSLRYPAAFGAAVRRVELSGEGYFEVAHNAAKPFHVTVLPVQPGADSVDVQVIGTHFNINSYADEPLAKTTLLEGRVKVKRGARFVFLNPGQQAVADNAAAGTLVITHPADADDAVAWTNGQFVFDNSDLNKILREFARWYNVDVRVEGSVGDKKFFGIFNRNSSLSSVMKALTSQSPVPFNYRIEGKKLIVQPAQKN